MRRITPTERAGRSVPLRRAGAIVAAAVAIALAVTPARADVTVIYAPAAPSAPLVARSVGPCERPEPVPTPAASPTPPVAHPPVSPAPSAPPSAPVAEAAPAAIDTAPPPVPEPAALETRCTTPRPIVIVREGSDERATLALTDCAGASDPASVAELSLLARPATLATRPSARELAEHADDRDWVAAGIRRLHPGLAERLRALAEHFPGHAVEIVAGFRPDAREGSRHLVGLALDVRVVGASTDAVHAFARRFDRTGVGLHRSGGFLHLDVRTRSVHWIDESGPGEPARIVEDDAPRRGAIVRAPEPIAGDAAIDGAGIDTATVDRAAIDGSAIDGAVIDRPSTAEAAMDRDAVDTAPNDEAPNDEAAIDPTELDADAVADEVLRGLGELSLPSGPAR